MINRIRSYLQILKKLVLAKNVPVVYPAAAQAAGNQGYVTLKIRVNESGDVENVDTVSGDPALASVAADAAKQWKFQPFIKDGKPEKVAANAEFKFAISDGRCTNGVKQATVTTPYDQMVTVSQHVSRPCVKLQPPSVAGSHLSLPNERLKGQHG